MKLILLFPLILLTLTSCANVSKKFEIESVVLSSHASSRATAYELSNKLIPVKGGVLASYLDYDSSNEKHIVNLVKLSNDLQVIKRIQIGDGGDNHGGASIVVDSKGDVHVFYGAHNNSLKYRHSLDSGDLELWSEVYEVSGGLTYPSAVISPNDKIFVIVRDGYNVLQKDPWSYDLLTFLNGELLDRKKIINSRYHDEDFVNRYIHYFAQLGFANGRLYLAYLLHERSSLDPVIPSNGLGYGVGLVHSDDEGITWKNWSGHDFITPVSSGDLSLLEGNLVTTSVDYDYRSLSLLVDNGEPVVLAGKYSFLNSKWSTNIIRLIDGYGVKSKIQIDESLYKSTITMCNENLYIIGEMLSNPQSSVENGWSNSETRISVFKVGNAAYSLVANVTPKVDVLMPNWYPATVKYAFDYGHAYFMYMIGNVDSESYVVINKFQCD